MESELAQEQITAALREIFAPVAELQALRAKAALTTAEVSRLYPIGKNTLEQMRMHGTGPDYSQPMPGGTVIYSPAAIEAWLDKKRIKISALERS